MPRRTRQSRRLSSWGSREDARARPATRIARFRKQQYHLTGLGTARARSQHPRSPIRPTSPVTILPTALTCRVERRLRAVPSRAARLVSGVAISTLTIGATACGDSTAPRQTVSVEVSVTRVDPPVILVTDDTLPSIACDVQFSATASGEGSAKWLDAKGLWYAGVDRSAPFDSSVWSASEIQRSWDKAGIGAGQTQQATWTFYAGAPFTTSIQFNYQPMDGGVAGDEKTATVEFTCGPTPSTDTPDPAITALATGPVTDALEPSDTLTVEFSATSPAGIWQTAVVLSGPCDAYRLFAERLQTSVTRSARLAIPPECQLGVPLVVTVIAQDAGLRTGGRVLQTHVSLVDETPPTLSALYFPPAGTGIPNYQSGIFYGGDSITIWPSAADNHELSELFWEILPEGVAPDDSLQLTGARATPTILVPLPLEASGSIQIRLHARDAAGLESGAISTSPDAIRVYPTVDRPTARTSVDGQTFGAIADTKRGVVYLLQSNAHRISVLSLATMTVTRAIAMPSYPTEFDITPAGDSLVVVLPEDGALAIVDLQQSSSQPTLIPLTLLDTATDQQPQHLRTLSNGKVFVSLRGSVPSAFVLIEVDLATGAQRIRSDAGDGGQVGGGYLARSLDHSVIVVNGGPTFFQRYDVASDGFGTRRSASVYDLTPVVDATGRYVAVGLDLYDESLQHLRRATSPIPPPSTIPTALSPDGQILYQLLSGTGLLRSRVSDGSLVDRTRNPIGGLQLWISDDGSLIVTVGDPFENPSYISTIDMR